MIERMENLSDSNILDTDSYKMAHGALYPPGTTSMMSYFESRGGPYEDCTLFGLQYLLHRYLAEPVTEAMVDEAAAFAAAHGTPFNREGWMHIVDKYDGKLPVQIRAIPEGTIVPTGNALLTIECDDPECFWVVSWLETMLVRLWYPSTIAITSRESKKILLRYLELSADDPQAEINFKLHDFGARGVTCKEQAQLGGAAHLLSFLGSDTIEGVRFANHYYHEGMAGFSIPASEHSTVSMWGRDKEYEMFGHYVRVYLTDRDTGDLPKLAACVSDTYDIFKATKAWVTGELKEAIKASGGTLVIRPDSGDPLTVLTQIFDILAANLGDEITVNSKGFKVLPPWVRVIQGDGIDIQSMEDILRGLTDLKWSASNIAFGSGGGLLQKVNRDTQKWAFKCCAAKVDGKWVDVRKDPITSKGKRSKGGVLDLVMEDGEYKTVALLEGIDDVFISLEKSAMQTVFMDGEILVDTTLAEVRGRMAL